MKKLNKLNKEDTVNKKEDNEFISKNTERLIFFFIIFLLICHIMGCFWIFIADLSLSENFVATDGSLQNYNWVTYNQYDNYTNMQMYTIVFYFTVTTIVTVGFGDIHAYSVGEKVLCILLMLIGVISFSFATGALSSIISNYDSS